MVARVFNQVFEKHNFEDFPNTASPSPVKLAALLVFKNVWDFDQLDVEQAFFQSELDSEIFSVAAWVSSQVVQLHKALCGLKQTSEQWYHLVVGTAVPPRSRDTAEVWL